MKAETLVKKLYKKNLLHHSDNRIFTHIDELNLSKSPMKNLISIIQPVIEQTKNKYLKEQLLKYFSLQEEKFSIIEKSFEHLTSAQQERETLNSFFHSWSQTNNSAMTVAGLSNRLTMLVYQDKPVFSEYDLFRSVASLNRIVDEDLAVVGKVLHSELFYNMATGISGGDRWMRRTYLSESAKEFKAWKDRNSLHTDDLLIGLLTTLTHEIYTHGEIEFILPKFIRWLNQHFNFSERHINHSLAWIKVHCGATEKNHFFHAVDAIDSYTKAFEINLRDYDLEEIITDYVSRKADVMGNLSEKLNKDVLYKTSANN